MIEGVRVTPLKQILDERGKIMHMLKCTDPVFKKFGEVYFSVAEQGVVKGWHRHKEMTLNYAVPVGKIKLVVFDDRENSLTRNDVNEFFIGPDNYCLVTIPPLVWNGWKGLFDFNLVVNCATLPYDPNEIEYCHPYLNDFPYDWDRVYR